MGFWHLESWLVFRLSLCDRCSGLARLSSSFLLLLLLLIGWPVCPLIMFSIWATFFLFALLLSASSASCSRRSCSISCCLAVSSSSWRRVLFSL